MRWDQNVARTEQHGTADSHQCCCLVTVQGNGTALITATTVDGGFAASCTITVSTYSSGSSSGSSGSGSSSKPYKPGTSSANSTTSSASSNRITVSKPANGTVKTNVSSAKPGDTVTITAVPDAGYTVSQVSVTDADGDELRVRGSDSKYTFEMPESRVSIEVIFALESSQAVQPSTPVAASFSDVARTDWFASAVDYVSANGLMTGSNGSFAPNSSLTRAMIAQVLYNMDGASTTAAASAFPDVEAGDWFVNAVSWAASQGYMSGYGNGRFGPNDAITREQLAAVLYSYAKAKGYDTSTSANLAAFADGTSTSSWAGEAIRWAVGAGLLTGSGNRLNPTGTATRAQIAQVLMNFHTQFVK